jgi:hypothetical protein
MRTLIAGKPAPGALADAGHDESAVAEATVLTCANFDSAAWSLLFR